MAALRSRYDGFEKAGRFVYRVLVFGVLFSLTMASQAGATQVHAEPEGLYAHQIAHVFFILSMGILIYWLRERNLVKEKGWRFIQYAALFFILYNVDAMIAHYLDGREDIFERIDAGTWHARIHLLKGPWELGLLYYIVKMDHLLSVPAVVFLYAGLRQLLKQAKLPETQEQGS